MNNNQIVEILPNLWLSDYNYALNNKFLKEKNIKVIINCSKKIKFTEKSNIKKIRIAVDDSLLQEDIDKMYDYLLKTSQIIHKYLDTGISILVHCYAGKQRSATVIAAYLMYTTNLPYKQIVALIKSKKKNAFHPEINFSQSLQKYGEFINHSK